MRPKLHNKARVKRLPYAATVTGAPGSGDVTILVALTGNITFNIVDPFCEDGDRLTLMFETDASPRTVTIGGANGAAGTVAVNPNSVGAVNLVCGAGKYYSTVTPT